MVKLFEGAIKNWKYVLTAVIAGVVFWFLQFCYQYFFVSAGHLDLSLIRSFAFSGATLIALALLVGPVFKLWPNINFVVHRRTFGVIGFAFIILHFGTVNTFVFGGNPWVAYTILDPFQNPLIFGAIGYFIFLVLFITSTDWATQKLSFKNWKTLHRLVYFGFILSVVHFSLINPAALDNLAGNLLRLLTFLVFAFELIAFVKISLRDKKLLPIAVGIFIILFALALFWLAFF